MANFVASHRGGHCDYADVECAYAQLQGHFVLKLQLSIEGHNRLRSLRQTRHPFELQHQAQRHDRVADVVAWFAVDQCQARAEV